MKQVIRVAGLTARPGTSLYRRVFPLRQTCTMIWPQQTLLLFVGLISRLEFSIFGVAVASTIGR